MEGFFAEKVAKSTATLATKNNTDHIDLTLKLSPCGQNAEEDKWLTTRSSSSMCAEKAKSTVANEGGPYDRCWSLPVAAAEGEKGVMRLQTMRRERTRKRLLLEKQKRRRRRRRRADGAKKSLPPPPLVSAPPPAGGDQPPSAHAIEKLKTPMAPCADSSLHEGGASFNIKTSPMQENESMISPKAMLQEMHTKLESPAKKHKTLNPCLEGDDAMDILRQMPNVTTTGDGPSGKRIEGLLYEYRRGQVCIVCVCHGSFFSPAEFVMHAGGKELVNPMKHITVCSNPF